MLLIDIPNQKEPKRVYLRGQAHDRQLSVRVYEPFEWRPLDELRRNYEKPLEIINIPAVPAGQKPRVVLSFMRDQDAIKFDYKFKQDQNRLRLIAISSCRQTDVQMEKPCSYEIAPRVSLAIFDVYFSKTILTSNVTFPKDQFLVGRSRL